MVTISTPKLAITSKSKLLSLNRKTPETESVNPEEMENREFPENQEKIRIQRREQKLRKKLPNKLPSLLLRKLKNKRVLLLPREREEEEEEERVKNDLFNLNHSNNLIPKIVILGCLLFGNHALICETSISEFKRAPGVAFASFLVIQSIKNMTE